MHHPVLGLDINDALLAATVMHFGGVLFTLNKKHFPREGILIYKAW